VTFDPRDRDRITLANGRILRIRPLRHGEGGPIRELFARLSPRTHDLRFFSEKTTPSSLVRMLADVDGVRRLALIAELETPSGGEVVALGNVAAVVNDRAEVDLVVADAAQRQGIGVALAVRLLQAAEARGYRRFVAHARLDNPAVRRLLRHVVEVISMNVNSGVVEIAFVRRRPVVAPYPAFVEATRKGEAAYNATREARRPARDPLELAYERIMARQRDSI